MTGKIAPYFPSENSSSLAHQLCQDDIMPGNKTILVVDDEEMVRNVAHAILGRCGYRTLLAEGATEAVRLLDLNADEIVLVILDAGVPGFVINPGLPIILSSGDPPRVAHRQFKANGATGFLQKPYTASRLRDAVGQALRPGLLAA